MGYDLTAYFMKHIPNDPREVQLREELGSVIAELEMGARNPFMPPLFQALEASEYDGTVSGNGIGRSFTRQQLTLALHRLCNLYLDGKTTEGTVRFLAEALERTSGYHTDERDWVYIDFG